MPGRRVAVAGQPRLWAACGCVRIRPEPAALRTTTLRRAHDVTQPSRAPCRSLLTVTRQGRGAAAPCGPLHGRLRLDRRPADPAVRGVGAIRRCRRVLRPAGGSSPASRAGWSRSAERRNRFDEALRSPVIEHRSAGSRRSTRVQAIRFPASSTWRPSAGYSKLAMKARARHPGSLHPNAGYQPSVARPMNPLLASPCSGLSRRCASTPNSKFTLPCSSTPRP